MQNPRTYNSTQVSELAHAVSYHALEKMNALLQTGKTDQQSLETLDTYGQIVGACGSVMTDSAEDVD